MPYNFVPESSHTGVTAEALRAKNRAKIDDFAPTRSVVTDPKFQVQGVAPPPIIFARLVRPVNALQLCC